VGHLTAFAKQRAVAENHVHSFYRIDYNDAVFWCHGNAFDEYEGSKDAKGQRRTMFA